MASMLVWFFDNRQAWRGTTSVEAIRREPIKRVPAGVSRAPGVTGVDKNHSLVVFILEVAVEVVCAYTEKDIGGQERVGSSLMLWADPDHLTMSARTYHPQRGGSTYA